eukprot:5775139-Prymnesium_polylepis.1
MESPHCLGAACILALISYMLAPHLQTFRHKRKMAMNIQRRHKTNQTQAAFDEIKEANIILQRYGRGYAWRKVLERAKQQENADRESIIKALNAVRPAGRLPDPRKMSVKGQPGGRARMSVMRGRLGSTVGAMGGIDDSRPRMRARHKGWLNAKLDGGETQLLYTSMKNGVFSLYTDDTQQVVHDTFPLMDCTVEGGGSSITLSQPAPLPISLPKSQAKKAKPKEGEEEEVPEPDKHLSLIHISEPTRRS